MSDLVDVTRAELAKLGRRPATWVLLVAGITLNQVFGFVIPYLSSKNGSGNAMTDGQTGAQLLAGTLPDQVVTNTTGAFPVFTGALALVLGALVTGNEFTGGTVKTLLTQGPRRTTVFGGQLVALVVAVGAGVLALFLTCAASSFGIAQAEDQVVAWPSVADLAAGLGSGWLVMAMWASLGAVAGVLLRSVALPIGLGVVWILGIENLVSAVARTSLTSLQPLRDVLPGVSSGSLIGSVLPTQVGPLPPGVQSAVSGGRGLATVTAYLALAALAILVVGRRRDVAA
ncbi:ABC-type transport system involved in multi-copper enzyme maturation, permease component [Pedococcus dokdonensis]|uniref:ABC-type transport system involved in multi-copper enzyme maturation, permease component n=1 Tax=Pedococcus dokdonensis TaxID=443156 RepID=A0A1H0UET1_9MICO|nr:ABC transporter permease subunit [Pedococcus dokdonensis]SDP64580.1 ABC-type transport system involved in multi-copper enzyme maturation, permease component [Pedococcus dokdonensis]